MRHEQARAMVTLTALLLWGGVAAAQPAEAGSGVSTDGPPAPTSEPADPPPPAPDPIPTPTPTPSPSEAKLPLVSPGTPDADPPPAAPMVGARPVAQANRGFRFGSYGRIIAGTDLRGGKPEAANVVAVGPRIVEPSYLELEMSYGFITPRGMSLRPVVTLAFDGTLFHDTGDFDAHPALRNLYLDAGVTEHVTAWVGSRMYRGDDIYLFSYWPLDDQNTVGGGAVWRSVGAHESAAGRNLLEVAAHAGVNRLNTPFQFQQIEVPDPEQGATTITQLDRERMVASATASYVLRTTPDGANWKVKVHGELHELPNGTRRREDGTFQQLPADHGFLIGAQLGTFGYAPAEAGFRRHLNVFARYAQGLAAFDELATPTSFGTDLRTTNASELSFAASGNWDAAFGNLMIGALSRRFIDADANVEDRDDGWEYAIDARPLVKVVPDCFVGADLSYQARFPRGLNPNTQTAEDPAVFQIAPMVVYSPMGPSSYDRPQLRLVYRAAHFNQAALDTFVPDDPRTAHSWTHFLGVEAEWWFNSTTYR